MYPLRLTLFGVILSLLVFTKATYSNENIYEKLTQEHLEALFLLGEKKHVQSIKKFKNIILQAPDFALPYRDMVEVYIETEQPQQGRIFFEKLLEENPANGYAHYALARLDYDEDNYKGATEHLKKAIRLNPEYDESYGPYGGLAEVYQARDNIEGAIKFYRQLIEDNPQNGLVYFGLGRTYLKLYKWDQALSYLNKALQMEGPKKYVYHSFIYVYEQTGQYKKAMENCKNLIKTARESNALDQVAYGLTKIGGLYYFMGDYRKALTYFSRSLAIASKIGETRREGMAINDIGAMYAILGNFKMALRYFKHSLELVRESGAVNTEIRTLMNIGLIYKDLNDEPNALDYLYQALNLADQSGYTIEKAAIYTSIGETHFQMNQLDSAETDYQKALAIAAQVDNKAQQAYILSNIGNLYHQQGRYQNAVNQFDRALTLGRAINDAQIIWESETGAGVSYMELQQFDKAEKHLSRAIAFFDSIRQKLDFETMGHGFLTDRYEAYPAMIRLLARNKKYEEAHAVLDQYKSRSLLKMLTEGQPLINTLLPDSVNIKIKKMNRKLDRFHAMLSREISKKTPDEQKVLQLDQKINALQLQQTEMKQWLRKHYSSIYQLTSAEPLSVQDIRQNILTSEQLIVEYVVGDNHISVFAISSDTLIYHDLAFSRKQLADMLTVASPIFQLDKSETGLKNNTILNADMANFSIEPFFDLYRVLLHPLESQLQNASEIMIIPDDLLFYFPFEAMVVDTSNVSNRYDFNHATYLIERLSVSYAPSASVLNPEFYQTLNARKDLLAFGNPDFKSNTDNHETTEPDSSSHQIASLIRDNLIALPNAEDEVQSISKAVNRTSAEIYTGDQATEERFKAKASQFKVVHLATHFLMNDRDPLYSRIVLANGPQSDEDGILQPYEIFHLELNTELVVLSACNTALGKLSKGEGLLGLARAFQYAGTPSLLVSLWNVDDRATSLIVKRFYAYLQNGKRKNEALRMAKLDYLKSADADHHDPFYWAPFILVGSNQPIAFSDAASGAPKALIAAFVLLFIISIYFLIRKFNRARRAG
ncbi:MAG: CHAT domain-containing protein [Caldithrix sp.]|nr:CHAT domain-containing protein [Caldithrix sp.]